MRVTSIVLLLLAGCGAPIPVAERQNALDYNQLNPEAGQLVLYEIQTRSANACDPEVGSPAQRQACAQKVAPTVRYHAEGLRCDSLAELERIRLGTLDDLVEDTNDFRQGITVRYVKDGVGANALWLMPLFPSNDTWGLPDACDNLGSPYAVRDYLHVTGSLSRACIAGGADEYASEPCWGDTALDRVIAEAHRRGVKVLLDVAFNHFGHNYLLYGTSGVAEIRERVARHEDLDALWDFGATWEPALLAPRVVDRPAQLASLPANEAAELAALTQRCPSLSGQPLVRAYHQWRTAFDWERAQFRCGGEPLEFQVPGFYLGRDAWDPSTGVGDNFTNNWSDVKFLYHHEDNRAHAWELAREREYLFRVLNYWVSRGVDGFRLDHTTDPSGGMTPNEWKYLTSKVDYYAWRRGQARPVFLAEEFGDQLGMSHVVDVMTEGYVGDLTGRNGATKDAGYVERVLDNMDRFGGHTFVMTALETHDERRLTDGTGFNVWTGAGFWGVGATTWSTPMLLMGQEFGEGWGLGFRRSDFLRARFDADPSRDALVGLYHAMIDGRLDERNRALRAPHSRVLPTRDGSYEGRIYAAAKWSDDGNVVFVAHNLWEQDAAQRYYLPSDLVGAIALDAALDYRLIDIITGQPLGACRRGSELAWDFPVLMGAGTRMQWMRLERCR
jgi:hypothetical protein